MLPSLSLSLNKKRKDVAEQRLRVTELDLFPPTSRGYPIFDYEKVCSEKLDSYGQPKEKSNEEFRDRDAEEIVRRLEANYGTDSVSMSASTSVGLKIAKRSKKVRKFAPEDVMDKGLGYVQEDDFIDDTEAYDEWVPTTMDTAKGGHYVNEGPLEFRQIDLETSSSSDSTSNGSGNSSNEDSSSLSSELSLSSSSSSMSISISTPKRIIQASASPMEHLVQTGLGQMMDEMRRRGEDLEVELAPSRALLQRREFLPAPLGTSHFIRTSSETTIAAIREFLLNLANNQMATPPPPPPFTAAEGDNPNASSDNAAPSSTPLPPKLRPNRFFIVDRRHQLRKLCPTDNLASAFLLSVHWDRHLVVFFDLDPLTDEQFVFSINSSL